MEEPLLGIPWDQTKEKNPVSAFQELVCSWERGRPTLRPLHQVPLEPGLEQKAGPGAVAKAADSWPLWHAARGRWGSGTAGPPHTSLCSQKRPAPQVGRSITKFPVFTVKTRTYIATEMLDLQETGTFSI